MKKKYVIDTEVLLDDETCIEVLRNGIENEIFITKSTIGDLERLQRIESKSHLVKTSLNKIYEHSDYIKIIGFDSNDLDIVDDIVQSKIKDLTFITNNVLYKVKCNYLGIKTEPYLNSIPFKSESQRITGFVKDCEDEFYNNCFVWRDGKPYFNGDKLIDYDNEVWKVVPKNIYQNLAFELLNNDKLDVVSLQSGAGLGKAQPLYSKILTPMGWSTMGEVNIGDTIIGDNGKKTKIIGTYPQGEKEVYRVYFNDDTYTDCCKEHLWNIRNHSGNNITWKTVELQSIMNDLYDENRKRWKYFIPMAKLINFNYQKIEIDPYIIGVLIGDGCLVGSGVTFTSTDYEIVNNVEKLLPYSCKIGNNNDKITFSIVMKESKSSGKKDVINNPLKKYLIDLGLMYKKSEDKFIPECYKINDINTRISILQGLMDTDGSILKNNSLQYYTKSKKLKDDITFLIQSLGGTTKVNTKKSKYTNNNGDIINCGDFYTINICLPKNIEPFRLSRKLDKYKLINKYPPSRCIVNVELLGKMETKCIMVDNESQLYITDDFIVTHNTFLALASAFYQTQQLKKYHKVYVFKSIEEIGTKLGSLPGGVDEKIGPYVDYITTLCIKLHKLRPLNRIFIDENDYKFNKQRFEVLPINYIRGATFEDCVVIMDECQNLTRSQMRSLLSRMGENVKCIILGDVNQIDNLSCNADNNGLNWVVKKFIGKKNYAHLVLKGKKSRGPICDLVLETLL